MPELDDRELGTVLAALRFWQRKAVVPEAVAGLPEEPIATSMDTLEPLNEGEIDDLCERLNAS